MAAATVAAIQAQTAPQGGAVTSAPARAPSPLFVSVPPRTSRVLHSEIYQRQLPPMTPEQQQLAAGFVDTPQLHAHHGTPMDAF
uniref:ZM domain-containing protein n=1 Tax=Mesocestoides corti TaxID=53468 RepID=A0A5K3EZJ6_MESCO